MIARSFQMMIKGDNLNKTNKEISLHIEDLMVSVMVFTLNLIIVNFLSGFNSWFQNRKPIFSETYWITYENFDVLTSGDDVWVIEFFTDRCAPCIENAPIWEQTGISKSWHSWFNM